MSEHTRFAYASLDELIADRDRLGLDIPIAYDVKPLGTPLAVGEKIIPNRLVIQPMEGCDGDMIGRPGNLTYRRYRRFASGGAGLLWFEATAVVPEGRANPRQLYLSQHTARNIEELLKDALKAHTRRFGEGSRPYTVLQLTHSGRYSRPESTSRPIIVEDNSYLPIKQGIEARVISDDELETLEEAYVEASMLAGALGFDAVDIKSCHRYLISELLSAESREGRYGGSFTNRTRLLLNVIRRIREKGDKAPDVAVRLNVYDAISWPHGFGVSFADHATPDITEPVRLVKYLTALGVKFINVTAGNPYHNPHVNRPYDSGPYIPPEHPLEGVARMLSLAHDIKAIAPDTAVVASGLSWLREYGANVAAGCIDAGWFDCAGFGRQAFAYPDFAADILEKGGMDQEKCCITCGKCTEIMRYGGMTGCVIRDPDPYAVIYKQVSAGKPSLVGKHVAEHI